MKADEAVGSSVAGGSADIDVGTVVGVVDIVVGAAAAAEVGAEADFGAVAGDRASVAECCLERCWR